MVKRRRGRPKHTTRDKLRRHIETRRLLTAVQREIAAMPRPLPRDAKARAYRAVAARFRLQSAAAVRRMIERAAGDHGGVLYEIED
jgi:hypothetical protein